MTQTAAATASMRRHIEAFSKMILGKATMKRGLAVVAGTLLNDTGVIRIASIAHESDQDIIYLDFKIGDDTADLREIIVVAARDGHCHVLRNCRLAQRPNDRRAVLLPGDHIRGHLRIAPDEIIHVDGKPQTLVRQGIAFAQRRYERLRRSDMNLDRQVRITDLTH
jgi:hypothetical protein